MNLSRAIAILPVAVALGLAASAQNADVDPKATPHRSAPAPVAPAQVNSAPAMTSSGQAAEVDLSAKPSDVSVQLNGGSTKALSYSWNNGPFITGIGNGAGGANTSAIQTGFGTFGYGQQGGTINNRLADDFAVPSGQTVTLNDMLWRTYQTGSTTAGSITGINVNIWNSAPLTGNSPDEAGPANSFVSQVWTGVYRVTSTTLTNTSRPIIDVTTDMSWVDPLPAGTFWVDASLTGSLASGPWGPPTTPNGASDNGRQFIGTSATWNAVIDATSGQPQDFPFQLSGSAFSSGCGWSNGPYITGIGNGAGGANTSAIQTGFGTFGYGQQGGTINNRLADDFVVPAGDAWTLQSMLWKTYQTGSSTAGTLTGLNCNLWNSAPLTGNSPDQTGPANSMLSQVWTGVYRVTSTTLTNTSRPIINVNADMSWASLLPAGDYWVDVSLTGSLASGPWGPPTTPNSASDNGRQFIGTSATWNAVIDATSGQPQDFLFDLTVACASEGPEYYCTAKTTSCGSVPAIAGPDGVISQAAQGAGTYDVTLGLVDPGTFGIIIYSTDGKLVPPAATVYGTLCIGNTFRVNPPSTGAVGGPCAATYTFDFGTYLATQVANPALTPAGLAVSGGVAVDMQVWYRDPPNPGTANLSNAMRFVVLP